MEGRMGAQDICSVPGPSRLWNPRIYRIRSLSSKSQDQEQWGCPWETNNYRAVPCPGVPVISSSIVTHYTPLLLKRKLIPEPPRFPCAEEEAGSDRAQGLPQGQTGSSMAQA